MNRHKDELWRAQFLGLRFEWYVRDADVSARKPWRIASTFLRGRTVYWFSLWVPRRTLRVFPFTMAWSDGGS